MLPMLLVLLATTAFAQKVKITTGKLDFLKGQQSLNIQYTYDNMGVGKYDREEEYVRDKKEDYNEKEAGKGDEWEKKWKADRQERFEPRFEELINKHLEKQSISVGKHPEAEYTLILKTVYTEPGFNVGVMRKPAFVNMVAVFVKTNAPQEEIAVIKIDKAPGRDAMGFDFDTGYRIQEAYAKAGKELAQYMAKNLK